MMNPMQINNDFMGDNDYFRKQAFFYFISRKRTPPSATLQFVTTDLIHDKLNLVTHESSDATKKIDNITYYMDVL